MYSKQEATQLRQEFWTSFGQYMSPVPSAGGEKVNWINYKTGVRFISFKMDADSNSAYIAIETAHPDSMQRKLYFAHFVSMKNMLEKNLRGNWTWEQDIINEHGKEVSRIYSRLENVNIYRKEDWPAIISFFKIGMTGIDRFWSECKEMFEMMG